MEDCVEFKDGLIISETFNKTSLGLRQPGIRDQAFYGLTVSCLVPEDCTSTRRRGKVQDGIISEGLNMIQISLHH